MNPLPRVDPRSDVPLYRQVFEQIRDLVRAGRLANGTKLPATRELAGLLGLNRATISAAYELLESEALISGHVGRGSFVVGAPEPRTRPLDWEALLDRPAPLITPSAPAAHLISFSASRPSELLFPLDEFRATCDEVVHGKEAASILQLGAPSGYAPLRQHLLEGARAEGVLAPGDDLIVTSGCQQAFDLLARVLVTPGDRVALEDPVYPGVKSVFERAGAEIVGLPVGPDGVDLEAAAEAFEHQGPKLAVITPNFQNPTGATLPGAARHQLLQLARAHSVALVENDIYGALRYTGDAIAPVKKLDASGHAPGHTVLLRSFSKIAFPGLRVGWAFGPAPLIARMRDAKQLSDLHTDQLSQAVLLRFSESGRLAAHLAKMLEAGGERLRAVLAACERHLPAGSSFTRPRGGMNLWVNLPAPLDSADLLSRAQRQGATYLPSKFFAVSRALPGGLRLSFAGLDPDQIASGVRILGSVFTSELEQSRAAGAAEPAAAMV